MSEPPISRRKLYQDVQERLLTRINAGEFPPGHPLPSERNLMETYRVGRPAIREAMQELARSGLITISHGERARVMLPTATSMLNQMGDAARYLLSFAPQTLGHLKEARIFLEAGLARLAAERADEAGLARLRRCLDNHREADLDAFLARDMDFHREIAAISGNPIFPAVVDGMLTWLGAHYHSLVRVEGAENVTLAEHQRIYDAIAAGDPDAASTAMTDHLNRASALYLPRDQAE